MANVAKDFAQLISQSKSNKTGPYDTQATVKRVEGNTVWVSIPGGVDETPIDKTVNCTAGDKVQVRVSGGRAWITGNASAPPTDDKTANEAKTKAVVAEATAIGAKETADAVEGIAVNASATAVTAKTIAEGVNEHFWHDNTGAHVTEVTQEEWNEPTDPNYHSGGNTLITTQGMAIRNGLVNLAEFGATGARIGRVDTDDSIEIANNAIKFCHEGLSYASIKKISGTRFIDDSTSNRLHFDSTGIHLFDSQGNGLTVSNGDVTASGDIEDGSGNVLSDKIAKSDFVISSHTTTNKTISGGSTMSAETQTFTKSRYYPLAISGWVLNGSNATNLTLVHLYISSQASGSVGVTYRIHNAGSSQSTNSNVRVYILWIKEN